MRRMLTLILITVAVAYVGFCVALYFMQRSFQYFPTPRRLGPAEMAGTFRAGDGTVLRLTVRPHAGPGAVLYFGTTAATAAAAAARPRPTSRATPPPCSTTCMRATRTSS